MTSVQILPNSGDVPDVLDFSTFLTVYMILDHGLAEMDGKSLVFQFNSDSELLVTEVESFGFIFWGGTGNKGNKGHK